jgi:hypothetical protein
MSWRKVWTALTLAAALVAIQAGTSTAVAAGNKAVMLSMVRSDQALVQGWMVQVQAMANLGQQNRVLIDDLTFASNSLAALYARTISDTSVGALNADSHSIGTLHSQLRSMEAAKIGLASQVNTGNVAVDVLGHALQGSGGLSPSSPLHSQVVAITGQMHTAKANLDQAFALILQASLSNYSGSPARLNSARSLLQQGLAGLAAANQAARHLQVPATIKRTYQGQFDLYVEVAALNQLRSSVYSDANLSSGERSHLLLQINTELIAVFHLGSCLGTSGSACSSAKAQLAAIDGSHLIRPKTEIILTAAAYRSAVASLTAMVPTLQSGIVALSATQDVTDLNSRLSGLQTRLARAAADIAPIDSQLQPLTTFPASHHASDIQVLQTALGELADANASLTGARSDAGHILAAIG